MDPFIISIGIAVAVGWLGRGLYQLMVGWDIRRDDEQEHRQQLERSKLKQEQRLAAAEKLHEVLAIVIADKPAAEAMRDHIDATFPKVRVENMEEEEAEPTHKRARSKKR